MIFNLVPGVLSFPSPGDGKERTLGTGLRDFVFCLLELRLGDTGLLTLRSPIVEYGVGIWDKIHKWKSVVPLGKSIVL